MHVLEKHFLLKQLGAVLTPDISTVIITKFYEDLRWCLQSENFIDNEYIEYVMVLMFKILGRISAKDYKEVVYVEKNIFTTWKFEGITESAVVNMIKTLPGYAHCKVFNGHPHYGVSPYHDNERTPGLITIENIGPEYNFQNLFPIVKIKTNYTFMLIGILKYLDATPPNNTTPEAHKFDINMSLIGYHNTNECFRIRNKHASVGGRDESYREIGIYEYKWVVATNGWYAVENEEEYLSRFYNNAYVALKTDLYKLINYFHHLLCCVIS